MTAHKSHHKNWNLFPEEDRYPWLWDAFGNLRCNLFLQNWCRSSYMTEQLSATSDSMLNYEP